MLSGTISITDGQHRWSSPVFYSNSVAILVHDRRPMSYVRQLVNHSLYSPSLSYLFPPRPSPTTPLFLVSTAVVLEASRAPDYSASSSFYLARFISGIHVSKPITSEIERASERNSIRPGVSCIVVGTLTLSLHPFMLRSIRMIWLYETRVLRSCVHRDLFFSFLFISLYIYYIYIYDIAYVYIYMYN